MRVLRTINNNVVICLDNNENEVVAFGKGMHGLGTDYSDYTDL